MTLRVGTKTDGRARFALPSPHTHVYSLGLIMTYFVLGVFVVSFIGGLLLGIGGLCFFLWQHIRHGRGSWGRYVRDSGIGCLILAGIGGTLWGISAFLDSILSGPPISVWGMFAIATVMLCIGGAPGGGLLYGCWAALRQTEK